MNDYKEVKLNVSPCSETATDILAAMLADAGYESFVADNKGLTAYIREDGYDREVLDNVAGDFPMPGVDITLDEAVTVEGQDWNHEWEKHYFQPIVVGNRCVIHSSFHRDFPVCQYDIVIDPKMAFGTGHHATTSLILEQLLDMDLTGKSVVDMGTGTGILAILSAMKGATDVCGIEIDEGAYLNAIDNTRLNGTPTVRLYLGDATRLPEATNGSAADLFIANINRNVITGDIARYADVLKSDGAMLLSGFYEDDIPVVSEAARKVGLVKDGHTTKDRWTCLKLKKV